MTTPLSTSPRRCTTSHGHGHATSTGISNTSSRCGCSSASECLLFGGLISTYMLLPRTAASRGSRPSRRLRHPVHVGQLVRAADELAHDGARRRRDRARRRRTATASGSATTAMLGAVFVGGQVYEFTTFYREGLGYTTNLFGSAFYTLTGFHGVHVSVGIIMLMALLVHVAARERSAPRRPRPSRSSASTGTSSTSCGSSSSRSST